MSSKGRRLKRYLGLKRQKGLKPLGGVESITPGRLTGWVALPDQPLCEVRLLVGPHLIARAAVDQPRPDVCEATGISGNLGFELPLPQDLPALDWDQFTPALIAMSADGLIQVKIKLISNPKSTPDKLRSLLQSPVRGLEGHCDGLQEDGVVRGWAACRGQHQPATIWLHSDGLEARSVICDQARGGLDGFGAPRESGFACSLASLPKAWSGKEIWFAFDPAGEWRLPQPTAIFVPAKPSENRLMYQAQPSSQIVSSSSYQQQLQSAPLDLQDHWRALEEFRVFLDGLEYEISRRDQLLRSKQELDLIEATNTPKPNKASHSRGLLGFFRRIH